MQANSISVAQRLYAGFGAVVVLLLTIAVICGLQFSDMRSRMRAIVEVSSRKIELASQMRDDIGQMSVSARSITLLTEQSDVDAEKRALDAMRDGYIAHEANLDKLIGQGNDERERSIATEIASISRKTLPVFEIAAKQGQAGATIQATDTLINNALPYEKQWRQKISDLLAYETSSNQSAYIDSERRATRAVTVTGLLVLVATILAGTLAWIITRSVRVPLRIAVHVAERIAEGDLVSTISQTGRDELGRMLSAIAAMQVRLCGIVGEIRSAVEHIYTASDEVAAGNLDLSSRTEQQAASLEETAASMTELTDTVKHNADNARKANALATMATNVSKVGNRAVQDLVRTVDNISGSSVRIAAITGTIEGIAFQTNILALNAAVEAARAGDQGRGFAVVASEVRSLAQRSGDAAKEIKELIGSSVSLMQGGAQQAAQVSSTIGEVMQAIKQVADIVGEIAAASEEQSRGIEQVGRAVAVMDEMTQQNAALVEEAAAAAASLRSQAQSLSGTVSVFNITDTTERFLQPNKAFID